MDFVALHRYMALACTGVIILVGLEGAVRAWFRQEPGKLAAWVSAFTTLALMITIGGGLGLLVRGARPREWLHFIYAVLSLATFPTVDALSSRANPRKRGISTLLGALIALVLIWRLFSTG